jgi:hypothetical protein
MQKTSHSTFWPQYWINIVFNILFNLYQYAKKWYLYRYAKKLIILTVLVEIPRDECNSGLNVGWLEYAHQACGMPRGASPQLRLIIIGGATWRSSTVVPYAARQTILQKKGTFTATTGTIRITFQNWKKVLKLSTTVATSISNPEKCKTNKYRTGMKCNIPEPFP